MKKLLILILTLAMTLSLAACGSDAAADGSAGERAAEISVVLKTLSSEYWRYVKAGCDAAAVDLGVTVNIVGPGGENDVAGQVSMIRQALDSGCKAIVVAPNDAVAAASALQPAVEGGIPVLCVDTDVGMDGETCFVGTSNMDAAAQGGAYAAEKCGSGARAVIIYGREGDSTSNMRRQGYEKACGDAGIEILCEQSGQNTTDGAAQAMEDMLNTYPDQIDMVLCHNDDTAIGAMNACRAAGVKGVTIVGFDGNKSAVDLILSGDLSATVAQQPYKMGYQIIEAAVKAVNGQQVESVIYSETKVITAENGQEYLNKLASYLK